MDDYRDLMTVGLVLVCAAMMLVAGQLYLAHLPPPGIKLIDSSEPSPALISRAPSGHVNAIARRRS
jgi:hypothetical protein